MRRMDAAISASAATSGRRHRRSPKGSLSPSRLGWYLRPLGMQAPPAQALTLTHICLHLLTQFNLHHLTNHLRICPLVQFNTEINRSTWSATNGAFAAVCHGEYVALIPVRFLSLALCSFLKFLKFSKCYTNVSYLATKYLSCFAYVFMNNFLKGL